MRILHVLPEFSPEYRGGIATYYETLLPAIAAQGHEVDVLVGSAFTDDHATRAEDGLRVEYLDTGRRRRAFESFTAYEALPSLRRTLAAAWALFEQANRGAGYDVVETTDFGLLFLPWVALSDVPPVLVQLHASNGQIEAREPKEGLALQGHLTRMLELRGLACADGIQTHSRVNAERWEERLAREVTYCPPPLRPTSDSDQAKDSSNGEKAPGFVAGRIQYWKGPTVLCEAQSHLGGDAPPIEWAGRDTAYRKMGESMSSYLEDTYPEVWRQTVRPIGEIAPVEVVRRQRAAQFVVVPSIWDVFNLSAVEAMQAASVVICSDGAGAADFIDHERNGIVVPAEDPVALAEAIQQAMRLSPEARREMGCAGRETIKHALNPERVAARRVDSYKELRKKERSPGDTTWLVEAIQPNSHFELPGEPLAVLNSLPLRDLTRYIARRFLKRMELSL